MLNFNLLNTLTEDILKSCKLEDFENLITKHELLIAKLTQQTPLKISHFPDYKGAIKSLGAWGGDFLLATGSDHLYFKDKGYHTIISYNEMVL